MTLGSRLSRTAGMYPGRVALVFGGRKHSYRELDDRAGRFAAGLAAIGVGHGDRVAVLLANGPEFAVAAFGTAKAGAVVVPLNTYLTAPELGYIIKDSGADTLVASSEFRKHVDNLKAQGTGLKTVIMAGDAAGGGAGSGTGDVIPFDEMCRQCTPPVPGNPAGQDDSAAIFYTSGTTGRPKGAVLTHGNLLSNADACARAFDVTKRDRFLLFLPMFHSFSFLVCLLLPVTTGARVLILPSVRPFSKVIKAVLFGRATLFVAIPAVYNILSMKKFPRLLLRLLPLRLCFSGAAPLPVETLKRFAANFSTPLIEGYGLTETSPVVSCNPLHGERKPGSVGVPIPGVEVRIVDDDERELGPGETGEIIVRGPNVMKGYLNDAAATSDAIRGGWLFTGDMGYKDADGYLFIVDRKKDLIIVHGLNVYPREVEEAIHQHPAVKEAAVIGIIDPHHGEIPKAFITLKTGAHVTEREIKEFLKGRLARYKTPRQVEFMESLPMSPTGKVLKRELRRTAQQAG